MKNKNKNEVVTELFTRSSDDSNVSSSSESAHKDSDPEVYETDMESSVPESENDVEIFNCEWGKDSEDESELLLHNLEKSIETAKKNLMLKISQKKELIKTKRSRH